MRITQEELLDLVVHTVQRFAGGGMERRRIIDRVEQRLRNRGAWEASDDAWSESTDPKSIGRAAIDWAISDLKQRKRLEHLARNRWGASPNREHCKAHGIDLITNALIWASSHPDVLSAMQAIGDDDRGREFLLEQYYAWDLK